MGTYESQSDSDDNHSETLEENVISTPSDVVVAVAGVLLIAVTWVVFRSIMSDAPCQV
jgi:hypothetical protein